MGPLLATVQWCLRNNYTVLIVQILVILIPAVAIYQACLKAFSEGV